MSRRLADRRSPTKVRCLLPQSAPTAVFLFVLLNSGFHDTRWCFAQDQNINTQVDQSTLKKVAPDFAAATPSMAVTY